MSRLETAHYLLGSKYIASNAPVSSSISGPSSCSVHGDRLQSPDLVLSR